jgi:hypothetical protein
VDVILPPGRHSWNVGRGWANTLQQEGILGRVLHVTEDSGELMEEYLKSPAPDAVLLCGFDHHMPFLHLDRKWKRLWKAFAAKKICLCQETVIGTPYRDNEKKTSSAAQCVDLMLYASPGDQGFFEKLSIRTQHLPFGCDSLVFRSVIPWEEREGKPLFFGKTFSPAGGNAYQQRDAWLKKIAQEVEFDRLPYRRRLPARRLSALLNRRKFYLEAPSPFQGIQTRQGEAKACGTLSWGEQKNTQEISSLESQLGILLTLTDLFF